MNTLPCTKCKKDKPLDQYRKNKNLTLRDGYSYQCKACDKVYIRQYPALLINLYHSTLFNSKKRPHGPPTYTKEAFIKKIDTPKTKALYDKWVASDYQADLIPSVDRIKTNQGYTLTNIQILTWKQNRERNVNDMSTSVFKLDDKGRKLATYSSIREAARDCSTNSTGAGITKAIEDPTKKAYGYHWSTEDDMPVYGDIEDDLIEEDHFLEDDDLDDDDDTVSLEARKSKVKMERVVFKLPKPLPPATTNVSGKLMALNTQLLSKKGLSPSTQSIPNSELNDLLFNPNRFDYVSMVLELSTVYAGIKSYIVNLCNLKKDLGAVLMAILKVNKIDQFAMIKKELSDIKMPKFKGGYEYRTIPINGVKTALIQSTQNASQTRRYGTTLSIRLKSNVRKKRSQRGSTARKLNVPVKVMPIPKMELCIRHMHRMNFHKVKGVQHIPILTLMREQAKRALMHMLRIDPRVYGKGNYTTCYLAVQALYTTIDRLLQPDDPNLTPTLLLMMEHMEQHLAVYHVPDPKN